MITAIGMMSGTSMDGIDVAMVRSDGQGKIERGPFSFHPYDADMRDRIVEALREAATLSDRVARPGNLARLERDLTLRHAEAVRSFLAEHPDMTVDLIGFHGQTILHRPENALTVQLGDGVLLAAQTGIDVVYDMRARDMEHGGQGAPLVPVYHAALADRLRGNGLDLPMAFVNIGGISNISFIPRQGDPIAFDTGPGNMLIDQYVARHCGVGFDENGKIAAQGKVDMTRLEAFLAAPFLARRPPKSLDRSDFTPDIADGLSPSDGARTLAAITAHSVFAACMHLPEKPACWIIGGGGRHNPHIMNDLRQLVREDGTQILTADEAGLDGDAVEAEAWAYLAIRSRKGLPLTFPTTTGCDRPVSGGRLAIAGR